MTVLIALMAAVIVWLLEMKPGRDALHGALRGDCRAARRRFSII